MRWFRWAAAALPCLGLVFAGCAANPAAAQREPGRVSIVAASYPFAYVSERVGGAHAAVTNLTPPGAEPHDLELTARQVGALTVADLVVYERGFQPAVDEAVRQSENRDVIDTTAVVPLRLSTPQASTPDPHVWLDPTTLVAIAGVVAARLATLDPAHAANYRHNEQALVADLRRLDQQFRTGLTGCRRTLFVTTHAAFGYLADRYGLTQVGVTGVSPDIEPSPARIAEVERIARAHRLTTIFAETLQSPAIAEAIAADLGLRTDFLDPVEGITEQSRGQDYDAVMRANLAALRTANGCP